MEPMATHKHCSIQVAVMLNNSRDDGGIADGYE
jgi:hypothetical protein